MNRCASMLLTKVLPLLSAAFVSFGVAHPVYSQSKKTTENVFCLRGLTSSVTRVTKTILPEGYGDLQDVQLTSDFRRPNKVFPFRRLSQ